MAINMGTIGAVNAKIGVDSSDYQKGVGAAIKSTGDLSRRMRSGINDAAKYGAALAVAGAAVATALVVKTIDAIDSQAKLAVRLRGTIEGLVTTQRAADLAGVNIQQLTAASRKLDVTIAEALGNNKAYTDMFDKLGISAESIANLDVDERILAVNEALKKNVPAAERAALSARVFGEEVGVAISTMSAGQFARAADEVDRFGAAVSQVDAETIQRVKDNFGTLSLIFQGLMNNVIVELAPLLEGITEQLGMAAKETGGFKDEIATAFTFMINASAKVMDVWHGLRISIKAVELAFQYAGHGVIGLVGWLGEALVASQNLVNKLRGQDPIKYEDTTVGIIVEQSLMRIKETQGELDKLMQMEWPGAKAKRWAEEVKKASEAASKATIAQNEVTTPEVAVVADVMDESQLARLKALRESLMTERELEIANHDERIAALKEFNDHYAFETEEAYKAIVDKERKRHNEAMIQIAQDNLDLLLADKEAQEEKLEQVRAYHLTAEEEELERFEKEMETLKKSWEMKIELDGDYHELKERMEKEHSDRMKEIREASLNDLTNFTKWSFQNQTKYVTGEMAKMTQGVAQNSRKMFEINKAAGIANAVIMGYESVMQAYKAYPPPMSFVMGGLAAAASFAQINAIRNSTFNGGGGGSAPSIAGSTPAEPVSPVGGGDASSGQTTVVKLYGNDNSTFSNAQMRDFLEQLEESTRDGGRVVLQ